MYVSLFQLLIIIVGNTILFRDICYHGGLRAALERCEATATSERVLCNARYPPPSTASRDRWRCHAVDQGRWGGRCAVLGRHKTDRHHVFVCVFFPSILDIKFVGRTSRGHTGGRSHRIFNPPSFCGACLDFCREKDSAIPFPRRP